ncbi:hypothetical protein ACOZ4N_05520 [Halorientalis pallida]|uniref:hypothetical protein n=1 Tax=Halorientalis pallida TaxID=2479928 RepID=UPI003C6F4F07
MIDLASAAGPLIGDPAAWLGIGGVQLSRYADLFQWLLHFIQTVLLLVTSLFLVYPVLRHPQNVAHSRGVGLLALGFLLLSAQWAMEFVPVPDLVAPVLALASAVSFGAGCWEFASSFVDTAERVKLVGDEDGDSSGGFGDDVDG